MLAAHTLLALVGWLLGASRWTASPTVCLVRTTASTNWEEEWVRDDILRLALAPLDWAGRASVVILEPGHPDLVEDWTLEVRQRHPDLVPLLPPGRPSLPRLSATRTRTLCAPSGAPVGVLIVVDSLICGARDGGSADSCLAWFRALEREWPHAAPRLLLFHISNEAYSTSEEVLDVPGSYWFNYADAGVRHRLGLQRNPPGHEPTAWVPVSETRPRTQTRTQPRGSSEVGSQPHLATSVGTWARDTPSTAFPLGIRNILKPSSSSSSALTEALASSLSSPSTASSSIRSGIEHETAAARLRQRGDPEAADSVTANTSSRLLDWVFVGQVDKSDRRAMVDALTAFSASRPSTQQRMANATFSSTSSSSTSSSSTDTSPELPFVVHDSASFNHPTLSLTGDAYFRLLARSAFCPAPAGFVNAETFRVWEAAHVGCIPIAPLVHGNTLDRYIRYADDARPSYWHTLVIQSGFRGHEHPLRADGCVPERKAWPHPWPPFVFVNPPQDPNRWARVVDELRALDAVPGARATRRRLVLAWWDTFRRFLRARAARHVRRLLRDWTEEQRG